MIYIYIYIYQTSLQEQKSQEHLEKKPLDSQPPPKQLGLAKKDPQVQIKNRT